MKTRPRPTVSQVRELERQVMRLQIQAASLRPFSAIAWTGGTSAPPPSSTPVWVRAYARALFRDAVNTWRRYWGDNPGAAELRTFYKRARADAFATFRDARNG